jgi:hypothetical protein
MYFLNQNRKGKERLYLLHLRFYCVSGGAVTRVQIRYYVKHKTSLKASFVLFAVPRFYNNIDTLAFFSVNLSNDKLRFAELLSY